MNKRENNIIHVPFLPVGKGTSCDKGKEKVIELWKTNKALRQPRVITNHINILINRAINMYGVEEVITSMQFYFKFVQSGGYKMDILSFFEKPSGLEQYMTFDEITLDKHIEAMLYSKKLQHKQQFAEKVKEVSSSRRVT